MRICIALMGLCSLKIIGLSVPDPVTLKRPAVVPKHVDTQSVSVLVHLVAIHLDHNTHALRCWIDHGPERRPVRRGRSNEDLIVVEKLHVVGGN